jgi:pimeloyl-ACP methyl ester carboxylesterase
MGDVIRPQSLLLTGAAGSLRADRWVSRGDRGALLMLHGGGQTRHSWDRAARSLAADGWEVFTVDARGHGESAWAPDGDYMIDAFVHDLLLIIDQLHRSFAATTPPVVVGASLGGITGLLGQGEHGNVARALVLVDITPRMEVNGVERIGSFMRSAPKGFATLEEVADAVAAYQPHRPRPASVDNLARNVRSAADGRLYWHWDPAFLRLGDSVMDSRHLHQRLVAAARRIDVPTLLVRGAMSDIVSAEGVAELRELIPTAAVLDVAGAGHMVAGDDNAVFVDQMSAFLRALPAADSS